MKILAIDTTALVASVALVDAEKTVAEFTTNFKKTHSQTIMPMIDYLTKMVELDLSEIDYIACASGPGSFTGLRIGAATAKGLAHGLNKKVVSVPTLDALAYNIYETDKIIVPIMDARRNQVYTAFFVWEGGELKRISDYMAEEIDKVLNKLSEYNKNVIFLGDGVKVHKKIIKDFNENYVFAPQNLNMQRASSVGAVAVKYAQRGEVIDGSEFEIIYLRKSQAEREYEEREKDL